MKIWSKKLQMLCSIKYHMYYTFSAGKKSHFYRENVYDRSHIHHISSGKGHISAQKMCRIDDIFTTYPPHILIQNVALSSA